MIDARPTPFWWRAAILAGVAAVGAAAHLPMDLRARSACGLACLIGVAFAFSENVRNVRRQTVLAGLGLQVGLAVLILRFPPATEAFRRAGEGVRRFIGFGNEGAAFVFGPFADGVLMGEVFGANRSFVFAVSALPPIIFVAAFFSLLYHYGVMQLLVRAMAVVMRRAMGVSGAESLSAAANVFMGQTEAPLIVKPYLAPMTRSELLAVMVGGLATVSGGMMVVYVRFGADPKTLLVTSLMAAPAGLYLAKILVPETETPLTLGNARTPPEEDPAANGLDALVRGTAAGLMLALNVAAVLIVFVALVALVNSVLGSVRSGLTLEGFLGAAFRPLGVMMGVPDAEATRAGELLGVKLVLNEVLAFEALGKTGMSPRGAALMTYALTGFANLASVGILVGGIGAMVPDLRPKLSRLGWRALLGGFLATLVNACAAGILLHPDGPGG